MGDVEMSAGAALLFKKLRSTGKDNAAIGLNRALDIVLGLYGALFGEVALLPDLRAFRREIAAKAARGEEGKAISFEEFATLAQRLASERGQHKVFERDLVAAAATLAGVPLRPMGQRWQPSSAPTHRPPTEAQASGAQPPSAPRSETPAATWQPYASAPTLEKLGRDLTAEAAAGKLGKVVGRDEETELVIETLCRDSKRNPLLLGPAGVGKTAIVEGLAQRVVAGAVPRNLRNLRIFALQATDLVQGMGLVGALEERMKQLIAEAEQPGVVLFLDEIHAVVGAGAGGRSSNDVANILKPALARGAMACIGATTDGEYTRYLAEDAAFERRFQPLRVQELGRDATLEILRNLAERAKTNDGIAIDEPALESMVSLAARFMRNRYFPDKAIDIFQHVLARARVWGHPAIGVPHVHEVVRAMVSVPIEGTELTHRLEKLEQALLSRTGLAPATARQIIQRLGVTMRGMDLHPARPNLVLVAQGKSETTASLAYLISEVLFGSESPVIEQDMSILQHPADINRLVGTAPGYVGYDEPLQLHLQLAQRPWSVVLFRSAAQAHPAVQAVLAQALETGYLLAASGKKVYLSDTICVLTVEPTAAEHGRPIGFVTSDRSPAGTDDEPLGLEADLAACVDLVCRVEAATHIEPSWVVERLLTPLARHLQHECNVKVSWHEEVPLWLAQEGESRGPDPRDLERWFESEVMPRVVAAVDDPHTVGEVRLCVKDNTLAVQAIQSLQQDSATS